MKTTLFLFTAFLSVAASAQATEFYVMATSVRVNTRVYFENANTSNTTSTLNYFTVVNRATDARSRIFYRVSGGNRRQSVFDVDFGTANPWSSASADLEGWRIDRTGSVNRRNYVSFSRASNFGGAPGDDENGWSLDHMLGREIPTPLPGFPLLVLPTSLTGSGAFVGVYHDDGTYLRRDAKTFTETLAVRLTKRVLNAPAVVVGSGNLAAGTLGNALYQVSSALADRGYVRD